MAGRKPVPDAIKDLTGSHNRRNPSAPKYRYLTLENVPVPKDIERDPTAREEWDGVLPELVQNGLICRANLRIFANYCLAYAEAQHAQDDVFENGRSFDESVFNRQGEVTGTKSKANPAITQAHQARLEMLRYAVEFGMTPSAATRVAAAPGDGQGKSFGDFMSNDETEEETDAKAAVN